MLDLIPDDGGAGALPEDDLVQPFLLESSGIRGDLVRLGPAVHRIVTRHDYCEPVARLLAEMLTLAPMLGSLMKFDGVFTLQTKGEGPVPLMVADMTSEGHLRGYAALREAELQALLARTPAVPQGVDSLLGRGYLAFTVDQGAHSDRYQGIVELRGTSLADCLQHYFLQSEQIQTGVLVAAGRGARGRWCSAGIVLQRIPPEGGALDERPRAEVLEVDEDAWRRAMVLLASCTEAELLDAGLPANDLLFRLFHEEGVRVFRRRALRDRCRCRRKRLEATLRSLPREEIDDLMIDGEVVVTCEFCRKSYRFDRAALDRIYAS